ncbi:unnamed protein product [Oikopleura dioica]|uniref:Uncharacterized protein n=1 Tax=Oikopleura dioica TaxID=34765 RepID=E4YNG4_OIKDI|nr:unnamed protein product [Oikopleura dioica]
MLRRANRIVSHIRWASLKGGDSINLKPKIENVDPYAVEISDVPAEAITEPIEVIEAQDLGVVADSFLTIYDGVASTLGLEVFAAIPIVLATGRFALFPMYRSMRQKMPVFSNSMQRMSYIAHSQQLKILKGDFASAEEAALSERKMQQEIGEIRTKLMQNYPIFNILPLGIFMSGNLYASWSLCRASTVSLPFMGIENLMEFNHGAALLGTGMQLMALKVGAELGNNARKNSGVELAGAAKAQSTITNVLMGLVSVTYPMAIHYNCPAFISLCWAGNTCITLLFSTICMQFKTQLGIPDLDAENARLAVEIQQIATEMTELQKSLKENSSFDNVVADRMEKIEEMEQKLKEMKENTSNFEEIQQRSRDKMEDLKNKKK